MNLIKQIIDVKLESYQQSLEDNNPNFRDLFMIEGLLVSLLIPEDYNMNRLKFINQQYINLIGGYNQKETRRKLQQCERNVYSLISEFSKKQEQQKPKTKKENVFGFAVKKRGIQNE